MKILKLCKYDKSAEKVKSLPICVSVFMGGGVSTAFFAAFYQLAAVYFFTGICEAGHAVGSG